MLKLYNTLTKKIETFVPLKPTIVGYYSCGPTVYDFAHLGHARTYVFSDILQRVLEFNGYSVKRVINITDVGHLTSDADSGEDKMEKGAKREGKSVWKIAAFYTEDFWQMLQKLNIKKPEIITKATDYITLMIRIIRVLEGKGYTYALDDGIYFDTSKFPKYGELTGRTFEKLQKSLKAGARVEMVEGKKNVTDFALWKFDPNKDKTKRGMNWWFEGKNAGNVVYDRRDPNVDVEEALKRINSASKNELETIGFPGWHIECSAMSMDKLGETFDIHTGGVDHIPIHHTNEIAQSEAATGKRFVNYWIHGEHLLVNGQKMSKSLGNFYRVSDIEKKGFEPLSLRYLFLTSSYRTQMNFTWEALQNAQNAFFNIKNQISLLRQGFGGQANTPVRTVLSEEKLGKADMYRQKFTDAINDDLNLPVALSVVWEVLKSNIPSEDKYDLVMLFDEVLGLELCKSEIRNPKSEIPKEIMELVKKREQLRKEKKFDEADGMRKEIEEEGFLVKDTPDGSSVKKILGN